MMPLILSAAMKGTVVLVVAWVATVLLRRSSAAVRHHIWLAALLSLPLLMIPLRMPQAAQVSVTFTATSLAATATRAQFPWVYVWAAIATLLLARFAWSLVRIASITWRAEGAEVRISGEITSPMTWGIFRPVVLLPDYGQDWTLAIQHERIHIARFDWFSQSFAQVMTAIFWFNPLLWFAASRLRSEAEQAVDDAVLASGADASDYAAQLVAVARRMNSGSPHLAVAMVSKAALSGRISAILDATRPRAARRWAIYTVTLGALCLVPLLAAFQSSPVTPVAPPRPAVVPSPVGPVLVTQAVPQPAPPKQAPSPTEAEPAAPVTSTPATPTPPAPEPPAIPTEPFRIGAGVTLPKVAYQVAPEYSLEARLAKYQGEVLLSVLVDESGFPVEVSVVRSLGLGLDEKAIEAVQQWRFEPGRQNGEPVPVKVTISISFKLL